MWGYTLSEIKPYLKYREREILFREASIAFFTGGAEKKEDEYCKLCKKAAKQKGSTPDCANCKKEIKEVK